MNNPKLPELGKPYQFTSTNQPKKRGRKPSKLRKVLKELDFPASDIQLFAKNMLCKNLNDIKKIVADPKTPILVMAPAKALLHDLRKGKIDVIIWLTERAFGLPDQKTIQAGNLSVTTVSLDPQKRKELLNEYIKNNPGLLQRGGGATSGIADSPTGESEKNKKEKPGASEKKDT